MTDTTVTIGTVIHGTLRDEDLLPAFTAELERLDTTGEYAEVIAEATALIASLAWDDHQQTAEWSEDEQEQVGYLINESLIDALQTFCPPHVYFGSIEGDGADFGFWTTDPRDTCDVVDIMGGNGAYVDTECGLYVQVSDHGNISVYELAGAEIWSAV
tara:strand:+ start:734 stop:1207 length:474 start_codon:yes stop_codon:yes gene_type:complete